MRLSTATKCLKYFFSAVAGLAITHQACDVAALAMAQTPEEFVLEELGKPLSPKAMTILRANNDIKVIKAGSPLHLFYKVTHPLVYFVHKKDWANFPNDSYLGSTPSLGPFDNRPVIFLSGAQGESSVPSPHDAPAPKTPLEFAVTTFHELGHHDEVKKRGLDKALTTPIQEREARADLFEMDSLTDDFEGQAPDFTKAMRSIGSIIDEPHDTLPALLSHNPEDALSGHAAQSYIHFRNVAQICFEAYDADFTIRTLEANDRGTPPPPRKKSIPLLYDCFKSAENDLIPLASPKPINGPARVLEFIKAVDFMKAHTPA